MKILIVEDHLKINRLLASFARSENHRVTQTYDVESALDQLANQSYDVIITDLMLPKMQGEDLIKAVRKISDVYIIVISAKVDRDDRIDVLKLGADDYLTKPFSVEEVMIKLKNVERRINQQKPTFLSFNQGQLKVMPLKRQVTFNEKLLDLTKYEYDVLIYIITNAKQILSRDQIIDYVSNDSEAFDRVIDAYIKNLRKKLKDNPKDPKYIKTHYGVGYQFIGDLDD
ncbi:response regulator transcription factor [Mycoplasmatota bacterium]|nr:response regulator transcription factor [Mycoplasmatota bacterium]